eukprot:tig00021721_g23206.t1
MTAARTSTPAASNYSRLDADGDAELGDGAGDELAQRAEAQLEDAQLEDIDIDEKRAGSEAHVPIWCWVVLAAAIITASSAGAVLRGIDAPAITRASWRLQASSLVLFPFFVRDIRTAPADIRERYWAWSTWRVLLASGAALALHFGCWIASLNSTTLTHSLLLVTTHPIIIVTGLLVLRRRVSAGEVLGSLLGFAGAVVMLLDESAADPADHLRRVTLPGDLLAFAGAIAVVGYMAAGRHLRSWTPLFMYAFPVTATSALLLAGTALAVDGASPRDIVGYVSGRHWAPVLYLALGPGFVGHQGLNAALKYVPPLVVSVGLTLEPFIGTLIGFALRQSAAPGFWTWCGAPVLVGSTLWVIVATRRRERAEAAARALAARDAAELARAARPAADPSRPSHSA